MALREFTDPDGTEWKVYDVVPEPGARLVSPNFQAGWLVFECDAHKVRVIPPPADWQSCSQDQLLAYIRSGTAARKTILGKGNPLI